METAEIIKKLRDNGFKITKIRKSIINHLTNCKSPVSVKELLNELKILGTKANKSTIYREMKFLKDNSYIVETQFEDRKKRFEISSDHHHHLVCEICGRIQKAKDCLVSKIEKRIKANQGFLVKKHRLEFFGVCSICQH